MVARPSLIGLRTICMHRAIAYHGGIQAQKIIKRCRVVAGEGRCSSVDEIAFAISTSPSYSPEGG